MHRPLISPRFFRWISLLAIGIFSATQATAAPPDLTNGGVPQYTETINLGPTGVRGWVYYTWGSIAAETSESRQIQVKIVAAGSPADGILAAGDVILGADGTGGSPVAFSSDARKSFAYAINDAEARTPAELKVLRWRAGTTTTETLTLRTMGAYSATAPYNCPKSAKILEEGLQYIMSSETAGNYSFGTISLLAGNNPADPNNAARMARAQSEARARIPSAAVMAQMMSNAEDDSDGKVCWERGHTLVFLSEYYQLTGDTQILPAIRAYAVNIAKNQSLFGTMGHIFSDHWPDGSLNGPMGGGYGVVNSAGMPCFLGLVLAKQCGITDVEIDPAIAACSRFYAYYANRGAIPYGEHEPGFGSHEGNGKSGLAALAFKLQPNRTSEARFFTQMATAAASEREGFHTGSFFNYLWSPLGAAAGGEQAATAHFASIRWMLDLNRKWDGSFDYDCLREGPNSGSQYHDFRMSTAALLVYALPLRQLLITGRDSNTAQWLTSTEVADAVAADTYLADNRTTSQLVSDLGNWSTKVQHAAANRLATLPLDSTTINQIIALATDPNGSSRVGACVVLGKSIETSLVATRSATLAGLLTDPQNHVRYMAADAMRYLNATEKMAHLNAILSAAASTGTPLLPLNEEDPLHMAHGRLAMLLFYGGSASGPKGILWNNNLTSVDRNLLYPAIKAVARNPIGICRSTLASIYPYLTEADFLAVSDAIVDVVRDRAPADRMFSQGARIGGVQTFKKFNIAEGVPLSLAVMADDGSTNESILTVLQQYAGSCKTVIPDPNVDAFCLDLISRGLNTASAQATINAIAADPNPLTLTPLKSITAVTADNPNLTLPANWTTLRVTSNDYANGASIYTWRKLHGAGNVSFTPNKTTDSKNTVVLFDGTPGQYLFEVKMTDSRGLTELTSTIAITLYQPGGTLPPNNPPVANNQSPSVPQATATPIMLTGTDTEGFPLIYSVATQPTHGKLTGAAPYLIYTSDLNYNGPDSFTFQVTDSEGQNSTATVNITVTAANSFLVAIYEPFNMTVGSPLQGQPGGLGLSGNWTGSNNLNVTAGSLAYGSIPTSGNRLLRNGNAGPASISLNSTLANEGLLNDGAVLWFSFLHREPDGNVNAQASFLLGSNALNALNAISGSGSGIGVRILYGKNPQPMIFSSGVYSEGAVQTTLPISQPALIVGKITWGATPSAPDTVEIYTPSTDLLLDTPTTLTAVLNQSNFSVLSMWGNGPCPEFDEIRFGPNYSSVLNGNAPMTADTTAPVPSPLAFHQAPTVASTSSISMVAVSAYDPNGVEYDFTCTAGGGHHSGWQSSPSYTDTGLTPGVLYAYTVRARDKSLAQNQTAASSAASATIPTQAILPHLAGMQQSSAESILTNLGMTVGDITLVYDSVQPTGTVVGQTPAGGQTQPLGTAVNLSVAGSDVLAPTPNPATFAVAPVAISSSSITMTATTGTDPSGVQYLFTETSGNPGGSSSSWQDSPVYTDIGLLLGVNYSYTVKARDKSPALNETSPSAAASVQSWLSIPTLTGLLQADAELLLTSAGLVPGTVTRRHSDTVAAGNVISQNPAAGSSIAAGSRVDILVSLGSANLPLANSSFDPPAENTSDNPSPGYGPLSNWTRSATNSGVNDSALPFLEQAAHSGTHVAFIQGSGNISQSLSGLNPAKKYSATCFVSERGFSGSGTPVSSTSISLDGGVTSIAQTDNIRKTDKFRRIVSGPLSVSGASSTLRISAAGVSGDNSLLIDTVSVTRAVPGVPDGGFENPVQPGTGVAGFEQGNGNGSGTLASSLWNFGSTANGITRNASSYSPTADYATEGSQAAMLSGAGEFGTTVGGFENGVSYSLSFSAKGRAGTSGPNVIQVQLGGQILTFSGAPSATPGQAAWSTYTTGAFTTAGGNLMLKFIGLTAGDKTSFIDDVRFNFLAENQPPVFLSDPLTGADATVGFAYNGNLAGNASDVDSGATLTFAKESGPAWLSVAANGDLFGTPTSGNIGVNNFIVSVSDGIAPPVEATLQITVINTNDAPTWVNNPFSRPNATVNAAYSSTIVGSANDVDAGATLTYAKVSGPAWLDVAPNGVLSGTPGSGNAGANVFTVSVGDGIATPVQATLNITVDQLMSTVPDVVGLAQATAQSNLVAASLVIGTVTSQYSATVPAGSVISQNPVGGASIPQGSPVDLVVSLGPQSVRSYATADIPVSGTVSGTSTNTQASDNIYQAITEIESGGTPKSRYSYLEHKWAFNVTGAATVTFRVEAHHTANSESDDFIFAYSTNGVNGTWQNMFMVTKTSDNQTSQSFTLPSNTSGMVHVRVLDTNRSAGRKVRDALYIDELYIFSENGALASQTLLDTVAWTRDFGDADLSESTADWDSDGLSNGEERIWGLDPTRASSSNPMLTPLDLESGTFRYTRRDRALTGLTYSVWTSPNLYDWTEDLTAGQVPGEPDQAGVLTEVVTLSPELLVNPSLFIRIRARD